MRAFNPCVGIPRMQVQPWLVPCQATFPFAPGSGREAEPGRSQEVLTAWSHLCSQAPPGNWCPGGKGKRVQRENWLWPEQEGSVGIQLQEVQVDKCHFETQGTWPGRDQFLWRSHPAAQEPQEPCPRPSGHHPKGSEPQLQPAAPDMLP